MSTCSMHPAFFHKDFLRFLYDCHTDLDVEGGRLYTLR